MREHEPPARPAPTITGPVADLVAFACNAAATALPPTIVERAALLLADDLVALLAAAGDPRMEEVRAALWTGAPAAAAPATVIARGRKGSVTDAAVANAVALSWMELDEGYTGASSHAGLYLLPALMALAEENDDTVGDLLSRLAAGYELCARLAAAWRVPRFTWHPHGLWASIGAATAAALSDRSSCDTALRAIRGAASLATLGDYAAAMDGAEIRNVWVAIGTANGLAAHRLARIGVDGPAAAPGAVFERLNGAAGEESALTAGLGERWAVESSYTKEHACCQSMHSAIDAALAIRQGIDPAAVAGIRVETPRLEMAVVHPENRLAAQFSLPHAMAIAFHHGDATAIRFEEAILDAPAIRALRETVVLAPWSEPLAHPSAKPARVVVTLRDGSVLDATMPGPRVPDEAERAELVKAKARHYAGTRFPEAARACADLVDAPQSLLAVPWRAFLATAFATGEAAPSEAAGAGA